MPVSFPISHPGRKHESLRENVRSLPFPIRDYLAIEPISVEDLSPDWLQRVDSDFARLATFQFHEKSVLKIMKKKLLKRFRNAQIASYI